MQALCLFLSSFLPEPSSLDSTTEVHVTVAVVELKTQTPYAHESFIKTEEPHTGRVHSRDPVLAKFPEVRYSDCN